MAGLRSLLGLALAVGLSVGGQPAAAQNSDGLNLRSPVLVLDYDTLFNNSAFGRRVQSDIQAEGRALVEENDRIEAELTAEELLLTSQRDTLSVDEFRALADAFDAKVQRIRSEQDRKARLVGQGREAEEQRFRQLVTPIIGRIMQDTGAAVVIDRDTAIVWAEPIDITRIVLAQVDRAIGAGPDVSLPAGNDGDDTTDTLPGSSSSDESSESETQDN